MRQRWSRILEMSGAALLLTVPTVYGGGGGSLERARLVLRDAIPSPAEIAAGPVTETPFADDGIVHCVYWEFKPGGTNPKFGCFLTAADGGYLRDGKLNYVRSDVVRGDFYDTDGALRTDVQLNVADAAFVDSGDRPVAGAPPRLLKIKYNDTNFVEYRRGADRASLIESQRRPPYRKARDMYTEVAATRLFGALGYAAEPAYSSEAVVCYGCPRDDAFKQQGRRSNMVYINAMVDQQLPGTVEISGWSVREIVGRIYVSDWSANQRAHFDGLAVIASLVHHKSNGGNQNSLVCFSPDGVECPEDAEPLMYIADLGSTFGAPSAKGQHSSWIEHPMWADADSCRVYLSWREMSGDDRHLRITEPGREFIRARLEALTTDHLRALFESAHFDWVDGQLRLQKFVQLYPELIGGEQIPQDILWESGVGDGDFEQIFPILKRLEARLTAAQSEQLSSAVIDQWVASFQDKVRRLETEAGTCPSKLPRRARRR